MNFLVILLAQAAIFIAVFFAQHYRENEKDMEWRSYFFCKLVSITAKTDLFANNSLAITKERRKVDQLTMELFYPFDKYYRPEIDKVPFQDLNIPVTPQKDVLTGEVRDSILIRIYTPVPNAQLENKLRPVIVWHHGGGWVVGSAVGDHLVGTKLAYESNYIVVNVDYRMSPNFPFPIPADDCYAVLQWIGDHIAEYGGDASKIIVTGESAGGNLAAAMVYKSLAEADKQATCDAAGEPHCDAEPLRGAIVGTILVSAALDNQTNLTVAIERDDSAFSSYLAVRVRELYQGSEGWNEEIRSNPYFAPMIAPSHIFGRFPATVIVVAYYDLITPENNRFAEKLQAHGRPVSLNTYPMTIHWFYGKLMLSRHGDEALVHSLNEVKRLLQWVV
jgi:acetyl esterase